MVKQHLLIIIDKQGVLSPKKYDCLFENKTKEEFIKSAKKVYQSKNNNMDYESYYFEHN